MVSFSETRKVDFFSPETLNMDFLCKRACACHISASKLNFFLEDLHVNWVCWSSLCFSPQQTQLCAGAGKQTSNAGCTDSYPFTALGSPLPNQRKTLVASFLLTSRAGAPVWYSERIFPTGTWPGTSCGSFQTSMPETEKTIYSAKLEQTHHSQGTKLQRRYTFLQRLSSQPTDDTDCSSHNALHNNIAHTIKGHGDLKHNDPGSAFIRYSQVEKTPTSQKDVSTDKRRPHLNPRRALLSCGSRWVPLVRLIWATECEKGTYKFTKKRWQV